MNIAALNEMQQATLEQGSGKGDVILLSPTGSGKTLAYLLPVLQLIEQDKKNTQVMIVVPSRELAQQTEQVFRQMGTGLKITACYGGHRKETEENNLRESPVVIVGTPGRLCDHLDDGNIDTSGISLLVLDEYDKILELGFTEQLSFILESLPAVHKKILTSATMDTGTQQQIALHEPVTINFLPEETTTQDKLKVHELRSPEKDKLETLYRFLCYAGSRKTIVFCNHREATERVSKALGEQGMVTSCYHGGMEQHLRDSALSKFRNGSANYLITTDLGARGLDIAEIAYIVHYHLPDTQETYIHRNGRTARMHASGSAVLLTGPEETVPEYVQPAPEIMTLPAKLPAPVAPEWTTLFINAGKKNKINKIDIAGFLSHKGGLKREDIGLIEVKDFLSFVAIRKSKARQTLGLIKNEKIKGQKVMMAIAR